MSFVGQDSGKWLRNGLLSLIFWMLGYALYFSMIIFKCSSTESVFKNESWEGFILGVCSTIFRDGPLFFRGGVREGVTFSKKIVRKL